MNVKWHAVPDICCVFIGILLLCLSFCWLSQPYAVFALCQNGHHSCTLLSCTTAQTLKKSNVIMAYQKFNEGPIRPFMWYNIRSTITLLSALSLILQKFLLSQNGHHSCTLISYRTAQTIKKLNMIMACCCGTNIHYCGTHKSVTIPLLFSLAVILQQFLLSQNGCSCRSLTRLCQSTDKTIKELTMLTIQSTDQRILCSWGRCAK